MFVEGSDDIYILGIETSCDETAASVVKNGVQIISSVVSSSSELHEKTGGVVPEIAARKQVEYILPVLEEVLLDSTKYFGVSNPADVVDRIDCIGVTYGPGLIGSLLTGVSAAQALSLVWNKPLVPVNHLVGHIYANFIQLDAAEFREVSFPSVALVVSGGHTDLVLMRGHMDFEYLGGTIDDAAGEAFDKTARLLDISGYKLGGPLLSKAAAEVSDNLLKGVLPRPLIDQDNFDFSFSGLKTAVKYFVEKNPDVEKAAIAKEFEESVVDVLVTKTIKAIDAYSASSLLVGGGVAANRLLRERLNRISIERAGLDLRIPPVSLCGDNAACIASAAFFNKSNALDTDNIGRIKVNPSLSILG